MTASKETLSVKPRHGVRLSQSGSMLLDAVRFLAAYVVLVHHFLDLRYSVGFGNLGAWGREAVCVFFVLSGFVIRFITVSRIGTLKEYAIDRISRIYSIVGPALIFTFLCEVSARLIHSGLYQDIARPFSWNHVPIQMLANVSFLSQLWGYDIAPLSNISFWSLSYEVVYYVVYGLIHYKMRHRWFWSALILVLCGPNIILLFPLWWLGAFTCDLYLAWKRRGNGAWLAGAWLAMVVLTAVLARHSIFALIRMTEYQNRTEWVTDWVGRYVHGDLYRHLLYEGYIPWLSQLSFSFVVVGVFTASFILFGLLLADGYYPGLPPAVTRYSRLIADSTFALYLFHLPLLLLLVALVGHRISSVKQAVGLMVLIPALTLPIAVYLDRLKYFMRDRLRRRFVVTSFK